MIASRTDRGSTRLAALVEEARARARASGREVLVSLAEPVRAADPLAVLGAAQQAAPDAPVAVLARDDAMYWERPADGFALVGLGATLALTASGAQRFAELDRRWETLIADAIVEDPSGGAAGVGPVLMGGFAFDADGPRSAPWTGFPGARLVLPRIQVARIGGDAWMTTTLLVDAGGRPDLDLARVATLRSGVLDALTRRAEPAPGTRPGAPAFTDVRAADDWRALVERATATIRSGALEKVVLARSVHAVAPSPFEAVAALRHLRGAFPSTYVFGILRGDRAFVGATPERLVRLDGAVVQSSSLAGSIGRGADAADDARRAAALLASPKDRAEHEMVRRVLCAALADVCDDIAAATEPAILTLPHVHHLHTPVTARLRPGHSLLGLVGRLHPTPAVGGTPHEAAQQFIRAHEHLDRGWYAAPVGWLGGAGGEFAVALRSAVIAGREAWLYAGCGIVADSDPQSEYEESVLKLRPMQLALAAAQQRDDDALAPPRRAVAGGHAAR